MGADLRLYDIASGTDRAIPIELLSDFDHLREHWIKNPIEYVTSRTSVAGWGERRADLAWARLRGAR